MSWKKWLSLAGAAAVAGGLPVLWSALGDGHPIGAKVLEAAFAGFVIALAHLFQSPPGQDNASQ